MLDVNVNEEYLRARQSGLKEKKRCETLGLSPYPVALDESFPETKNLSIVELPVQDIPADRIIGTKSEARSNVFSASFLPLAEPESEFAMKWTALLKAHLSDEGIRDPIETFEYLGNFYVQEGNKRTSVLKYFGAVRIPAKIKRIIPVNKADQKVAAYYEFLEFHRLTGLYDVQFKKTGEFALLYSAIGKRSGERWTNEEISVFSSSFNLFKDVFNELEGEKNRLQTEEALLLYLNVHSYEKLCSSSKSELKKQLVELWSDVRSSAEPDAITLNAAPKDEEKHNLFAKLIPSFIQINPKHLNVAFVYQKDETSSLWTKTHLDGAAHLSFVLKDAVTVKNYFHADSPESAERAIDLAVAEGADVVFSTAPQLMNATLKAAIKYPKIRFFDCSASKPISSVRSYYCRVYEAKFITGAIAGALAENDRIGYIGSYPILGVPASINAFALGARLTNPRAKVLLEWNCTKGNAVSRLKKRGVKVISNKDIPLSDVDYMSHGDYGTFTVDGNGVFTPVGSPFWIWGNFYERLVRAILSGTEDKKDSAEAVNYWWGMDSGVVDVKISETLPEGVKRLAGILTEKIKAGALDPFMQRIVAQDGSLISDGENKLSLLEILRLDKLCDVVVGSIPDFDELLPVAKTLVREMGTGFTAIPPESEEKR